MKTTLLLLLISTMPTMSHGGCGTGCEEHAGVCACFGTPEIAPSVQPSDEKPRHNGIPSWQAGEVKADIPTSLSSQDMKADQERKDAEIEGKTAAKIPQ